MTNGLPSLEQAAGPRNLRKVKRLKKPQLIRASSVKSVKNDKKVQRYWEADTANLTLNGEVRTARTVAGSVRTVRTPRLYAPVPLLTLPL